MKRQNIAFDKKTVRRVDENGYLHVAASHITKATVNPYYGHEIPGYEEAGLDSGKIYYGLRDPEELQKSLPTWAGIPLHLAHHIDSAENPQKLTRVGTVGTEIAWNDPYVDAPLSIWDQKAIDGINDGSVRELSCAYRYDPDFTPGVYEGEHYDFVMRNIRGNHVAIVEEGRAGSDVLVADAAPKGVKTATNKTYEDIMGKLKDWFKGTKDNAPEGIEKNNAADTDISSLVAVVETLKEKLAPEDFELLMNAVKSAGAAEDEDPEENNATDSEEEGATDNENGACDEDGAEDEDETAADDDGEEEKAVLDHDAETIANIINSVEGLTDEQKKALADGFAATCHGITGDEDETEGEKDKEETVSPAALDKALKKHSKKLAADSALLKKQAVKMAMDNMRRIAAACQKVRPLVGEIDAMAFDSAANVYGYALEQCGVKARKYDARGWEGMVDMLVSKRGSSAGNGYAKDSAPIPADGPFANLRKISIG